MTLRPPSGAVERAVSLALAEDLEPMGDITAALLPLGVQGEAVFVARTAGVVAGIDCVLATCRQIDASLQVTVTTDDGGAVSQGAEIARVSGAFAAIVTAERTALNFLCHLSGVASLTARFVAEARQTNPYCRVLDTRKTTPGLRALEKAAVRAGGGTNHRGSLSEGVLIKDNHLGYASISAAVSAARLAWPGRLVEVECDRLDQVAQAVAAGATMVLCDNMSLDELAECVELVRAQEAFGRTLVEASGRVSLATVGAIAATGVDFISVGALTHSAPVLDIGLDLAGDGASD